MLGFGSESFKITTERHGAADYRGYLAAPNEYYVAAMSAANLYNGNRCYVLDPTALWADQGDDDTAVAHAMISDNKDNTFYRYTARTSVTSGTPAMTYGYLTLATSKLPTLMRDLKTIIGQKVGDEACMVRQAYTPTYKTSSTGAIRGPFEALLFPLLSTGTDSYNDATYDKLPLTAGAAMQVDIVDKPAFLAADGQISMSPMSERDVYFITKPISIDELLRRECKLFGYCLTWANGKITLRDVIAPSISWAARTIDESARAERVEMPELDMSTGTIINQYTVRANYNYRTDKYALEMTVSDVDSDVSTRVSKGVTIEHPGLMQFKTSKAIENAVDVALRGRPLRYPSPVVDVSLAPKELDLVYPGDTVTYTSSTTPDPIGTGSLSTTVKALVLRTAWNHQTGKGSATLMLLVYADSQKPWAPAAYVDQAQTNGGWDPANDYLYVTANEFGKSGDPDDGSAFGSGDYIDIRERAPGDPTSPQEWTNIQVTAAYETDGAGILTLDSPTLAGWDANKEYVITFTDYPDATVSMKTRGTWQADQATEKLDGGTIKAQRYG
jgi:hypothetical protein